MDGKQPVRLRMKPIKDGMQSLYLDIYHGGRRSYEFLRLYLIPEKTRADKEKNRQTMRLAEAVQAKRIVEVQNGVFGFDKAADNVNFLDYFKSLCDARKGRTQQTWCSVYRHLCMFCKPSMTFRDVTTEWVKSFRAHLDTKAESIKWGGNRKLSQNTKMTYFTKLHCALSLAVKDGYLARNPMDGVDRFRQEETEHVYLTLDEIRRMASAEWRESWDVDIRAFLFSCMTGIRKSDIERMTWGDVSDGSEFTRITFRQKKTRNVEYLDISDSALRFMGKRGKDADLVFAGFTYDDCVGEHIRSVADSVGISKRLTFHSARHSFAIMMLEIGEDLYTVSKLLGHRNIKTTQIYAKIMDTKKQSAVRRIPKL